MKKYIYSLVVLMTSCVLMTACGDDDTVAPKGAPAQGAVGTYEGRWIIENQTTGETNICTGSVELTAQEDQPYVTYIAITCTGSTAEETAAANQINGKNSYSNIVNSTTGFSFSTNSKTAGDLGCECDGKIDEGHMRMKLLKVTTNARTRKEVIRYFTFEGQKVLQE